MIDFLGMTPITSKIEPVFPLCRRHYPPARAHGSSILPRGKLATVIEWISRKRKAQRSKQATDEELRASLSDKIARYEAAQQTTSPAVEEDDHTELMVNGKKLRVAKKEITLTDV